MRMKLWLLVPGLCLLGGERVSAQITKGVMAIKGAEMS